MIPDIKYVALLIAALTLASCGDKYDLDPSTTNAVCKALIGPIKYNSTNKQSRRYAAELLALDVKQRNQVGQELHCPQYR